MEKIQRDKDRDKESEIQGFSNSDKNFNGGVEEPLTAKPLDIIQNSNSSMVSNNISSEKKETVVENSLSSHSHPKEMELDYVPKGVSADTNHPFKLTDRDMMSSLSDISPDNTSILFEKSVESGSFLDIPSSQSTLCNNIGKLKMGRARGRPKKKIRASKNPFDLGLKISKCLKNKGVFKKSGPRGSHGAVLDTIQEENKSTFLDETDLIIESAELLGLTMPLGKEVSKKEILQRLEHDML